MRETRGWQKMYKRSKQTSRHHSPFVLLKIRYISMKMKKSKLGLKSTQLDCKVTEFLTIQTGLMVHLRSSYHIKWKSFPRKNDSSSCIVSIFSDFQFPRWMHFPPFLQNKDSDERGRKLHPAFLQEAETHPTSSVWSWIPRNSSQNGFQQKNY